MSDVVFSSWGAPIMAAADTAEENRRAPAGLPGPFDGRRDIKAFFGWDGIVLCAEDVNVVDMCRAYMTAVRDQSCGKCVPCQTGTRVMTATLERICRGAGAPADIDQLKDLAEMISQTAKCGIGQSGPMPILHALHYFRPAFEAAVAKKKAIPAGEYRSHVTAPCMEACPIHLDIPRYVECIKEGDFEGSLAVIRRRLPLPGVVGRVCVRPCESHCRRANLDEPISIKYLKRFVADEELAHHRKPAYPVASSERKGSVAIVGAGPAGLTCAFHLARMGHAATIYELLPEPGGMSAMGIPDYRLPRPILQNEVQWIQEMGVTIHYGATVGRDILLSRLEADHDAVFVGIGAQDSTSMRVEGEDKGYRGFIPGVQYLRDINMGRDPYPEGRKVVVIGGGNVAIDCVRSSFRIGKEDVHLVYRRTRREMPADEVEIVDAEEEDVQFHFLTTPVRVLAENGRVTGLTCIRMQLGAPDKSGRRRPVPVEGSEFSFDCDTVVPAIGQRVDLSLLEGVEGVATTRWNTIVVDPFTKQTNRPKIFSAGDCETGPDALITACAGGMRAAVNIDRLINEQPVEYGSDDHFERLLAQIKVYDAHEKLGEYGKQPRRQLEMLAPGERKTTFDEVEAGFSVPDAIFEARRCLRCYRVAMVAV